jgi:hypothetical protein
MSEALKEISLILDVWDDIFSDFDPRPLDERALSEDFVNELKKRYRETPKGALLLSFYAPKSLKDDQSEQMVIRRLRKYFKDKALQKKRDIHRLKVRGALFVLVGALSLCSITLISYFEIFSQLVIQLLEILFVPLGWFGIWEGFSKIVNASPMLAHERELYHKLSTAEYQFHYEA